MVATSKQLHRILFHVLMAALVILFLFPFLWSLATSLKTSAKVLAFPPELLPKPFSLEQYQQVLSTQNRLFLISLFNTLAMAGLSLLLMVLVAYPAAYAFVFLRFRGSGAIFLLILGIMMVPSQSLVIPLYQLLVKIGLYDSKSGLSLVYLTFGFPFCVFVLRNALASMPSSIRESALLDGCSDLRILIRIYFPLTLPALSTAIVFLFLTVWSDFMLSLLFSSSIKAKNINVALNIISATKFNSDWGIINAGAVISMLPPLLIFVLLQKYYLQGMVSGADK